MKQEVSQYEKDQMLMKQLGLSEDFENFRKNAGERSQKNARTCYHIEMGGMVSAMTTAIGGAALMTAGALTAPVLAVGAVVAGGSMLASFFAKKKGDDFVSKSFDDMSAKKFLELMDTQNKSFGNKHYEEFVARTLKDNPGLANELSSVSDKFKVTASKPGLQPTVESTVSQPQQKEVLQEKSDLEVVNSQPAPNEYSSDKAVSAREPVEIEKNNQFMSQLQKLDKSEPSLGM